MLNERKLLSLEFVTKSVLIFITTSFINASFGFVTEHYFRHKRTTSHAQFSFLAFRARLS